MRSSVWLWYARTRNNGCTKNLNAERMILNICLAVLLIGRERENCITVQMSRTLQFDKIIIRSAEIYAIVLESSVWYSVVCIETDNVL